MLWAVLRSSVKAVTLFWWLCTRHSLLCVNFLHPSNRVLTHWVPLVIQWRTFKSLCPQKNIHRSHSSNECRADLFGCTSRVHQCQTRCTNIWRGSAWIRRQLKHLRSKRCCSEPYVCIYNQHRKGEAFKNAFCSAGMLQPFKGTCCIAVIRPSCSTSTQQLHQKQKLLMTPPHFESTFLVPGKSICFFPCSASSLPQQPCYFLLWSECSGGANAVEMDSFFKLTQWSLIFFKAFQLVTAPINCRKHSSTVS